MVFKDNDAKEVVIWKHIEKETKEDYIYLKEKLDNLGYTIQSVVLDGKSGIEKAFKDIPRQMCHFHMKQIIHLLLYLLHTQTIHRQHQQPIQ